MRHLLFLAGCVLLCASIASAQSLGAVAKKEKERREKLGDTETAKVVITEAELENASSDDADEARRPTGPPRVRNPITDAAPRSTDKPKSDNWDDIFYEYQQAYRSAKRALELGKAVQKHCEDGTEPPPLPAIPGGGLWMLNCMTITEGIARVENSMKQIQREAHDRARRLGIPPGRARLR